MKAAVAACSIFLAAGGLCTQAHPPAAWSAKPAGVDELRAQQWLKTLGGNIRRDRGGRVVEIDIFGSDQKAADGGQWVRGSPAESELAHLQHLPGLKTLTISNYRVPEVKNITDAGLKSLGQLAGLESLSLGGLAITDAGLASLRGLKSLRRLSLRNVKRTDTGLVHLAELPALKSLSLSNMALTEADVAWLKKLPALSELRLGQDDASLPRMRLGDDWVVHFNDMSNLKSLELRYAGITSAATPKMKLANVRSLALEGDILPHDGPCGCQCQAELETIDLRGCKNVSTLTIRTKRLVELQGPPALESLNIEYSCVSDSALEPLKHLANLRQLRFTTTKISTAGLAHLRNLKELQSLAFQNVEIAADGFAFLDGLAALRTLELEKSRVPTWEQLRQLKSLTKLKLRDTGLTQEEAVQLHKALPACTVDWDDSGRYAP